MKRVLFVDDEPHLLDGLRGRLWRNRNEWQMEFVSSGKAALEALARGSFDIIVSDIRMPAMDGATLLGHVREHYPQVIRIALSGYTELEGALRALPVAHQFLSKPCEGPVIENVLERALGLHSLLRDPAIRNAVGGVRELPSTPRIYSALTKMLADPDVEPRAVASVIEQDPAVSARVLQIVNSAFFGLSHSIVSLPQAVLHLGIEAIKNLVFSVELFRSFQVGNVLSLDLLQRHSYLTAKIAAALVTTRSTAKEVFTAALLHDVGKLVLASKLPQRFAEALRRSAEQRRPLYAVEEELHGFTHAEAGAYLLGLWGLPYPIVEAVAHHHHPQRVKQCRFDTLAAVYVADHLAWEVWPQGVEPLGAAVEPLDLAYIESLGLGSELEKWPGAALQQAELLGVLPPEPAAVPGDAPAARHPD
jgi:HD-like signal output (HDOD) protein/ActR/RegA family two-component response regulator